MYLVIELSKRVREWVGFMRELEEILVVNEDMVFFVVILVVIVKYVCRFL